MCFDDLASHAVHHADLLCFYLVVPRSRFIPFGPFTESEVAKFPVDGCIEIEPLPLVVDIRTEPTAEAALEWLEKNKPTNEPTGIVWGDARVGNIIFADDSSPAAVVDWEMVTLGSPETDFGWAIFVDRHHSEGLGVPRLEGFPDYDETIAFYQDQLSREQLNEVRALIDYRLALLDLKVRTLWDFAADEPVVTLDTD